MSEIEREPVTRDDGQGAGRDNGQDDGVAPETHDAKAGTVRDLGYAPYDGPRQPQSTRYRTIASNLIRASWRGFWRMKAWAITTAITVFVMGAIMYVLEGTGGLLRAGALVPRSEEMVMQSFDFLTLSAFFLSLTVLSQAVCDDLRTGAFVFYFARPLRPIDYVAGKLLGAVVVMAMIFVAGPLVLAFFRIGLADSGEIVATIPVVPRTLFLGFITTAVFAVVPLAFSATSSRRRYAVSLWAAFYLVIGPIAVQIARVTGIREIAAFNILSSLDAVALAVFAVETSRGPITPPSWLAGVVLAGYVVVGLAFVYWRVSSAERAGLGGSR